jgi:hypothetical protein
MARDEGRVRGEFWPKLRRFAVQLPFAEDLVATYLCAFDRRSARSGRPIGSAFPPCCCAPLSPTRPRSSPSRFGAFTARYGEPRCAAALPPPAAAEDWATPLRGSSAPHRIDCRILPHVGDIHRGKVTTHYQLDE